MPRTEVNLTASYQSVGTGPLSVTVKEEGDGNIYLNTQASDTASMKRKAEPSRQFIETSAVEIFVKGSGYVVIVDDD